MASGKPVSPLCFRVELTSIADFKTVNALEKSLTEGLSDSFKFSLASEKNGSTLLESLTKFSEEALNRGFAYLFEYQKVGASRPVSLLEEFGTLDKTVADDLSDQLLTTGVWSQTQQKHLDVSAILTRITCSTSARC